MKKVATLAVAALLMTGFAFAHEGDKKKGKTCCKDGKECTKTEKKEAKAEKAEKKEVTKTVKAEIKAAGKTAKKA
jgi:hypothetical protein